MIVYDVRPSTYISLAAFEMVQLANKEQTTVTAVFNEIELSTDPDFDILRAANKIVEDFNLKLDLRLSEYRNSPEGKAKIIDLEIRKQQNQKIVNDAVAELNTLDFSNLAAVINWFDKVTNPTEFCGVKVPSAKIVQIFENHGYLPSVNLGENFNGEDKENFARYIIGQALLGLKSPVGRIHPVFKRFAKEWREKFILS